MKKAIQAIHDCAYLCYLVGMLTLVFAPIVVGIGFSLLTIMVWLGALDWPMWGRALYTPFGVVSYLVVREMGKEMPQEIAMIYRRWNRVLSTDPLQLPPVKQHPTRHQPRHVRVRLLDDQPQEEA